MEMIELFKFKLFQLNNFNKSANVIHFSKKTNNPLLGKIFTLYQL